MYGRRLNGLPIRKKKKKHSLATPPADPKRLHVHLCVYVSAAQALLVCVRSFVAPRSHVARTCFSGSCARADQPFWCLSVFFIFLSVVCFFYWRRSTGDAADVRPENLTNQKERKKKIRKLYTITEGRRRSLSTKGHGEYTAYTHTLVTLSVTSSNSIRRLYFH